MADVIGPAVAALLQGGPSDLPSSSRQCLVDGGQDKVKIQFMGGYEQFERTDEVVDRHGERQVVYRWTTRTRVAE
ncbi:DUF5988 family protein [Micromonospora sp. DT228]|uniref:DUF5988 family protein n=1 Tax=unclassified Micromonospora TaxID=2617518 RepID=UPI00371391C1